MSEGQVLGQQLERRAEDERMALAVRPACARAWRSSSGGGWTAGRKGSQAMIMALAATNTVSATATCVSLKTETEGKKQTNAGKCTSCGRLVLVASDRLPVGPRQ